MFNNRTDLAKAFYGTTLELGVAGGSFSRVIASNPEVKKHYAIDRWADHHDLLEYKRACEFLLPTKSVVLRMTFKEALALFDDEFFDAIYIDGYAHTGQNEGETLNDWWPKLKTGGIFSGHDYHKDFPKTIEQVNLFAQKHEKQINLTGEIKYPSWYFQK